MRTGDRVAILRPVQSVKVGDMVRGLDPADFGWTKVEFTEEKQSAEFGRVVEFRPHLNVFVYHDHDELVEVYVTPDEASALKAEAMDLLGEE